MMKRWLAGTLLSTLPLSASLPAGETDTLLSSPMDEAMHQVVNQALAGAPQKAATLLLAQWQPGGRLQVCDDLMPTTLQGHELAWVRKEGAWEATGHEAGEALLMMSHRKQDPCSGTWTFEGQHQPVLVWQDGLPKGSWSAEAPAILVRLPEPRKEPQDGEATAGSFLSGDWGGAQPGRAALLAAAAAGAGYFFYQHPPRPPFPGVGDSGKSQGLTVTVLTLLMMAQSLLPFPGAPEDPLVWVDVGEDESVPLYRDDLEWLVQHLNSEDFQDQLQARVNDTGLVDWFQYEAGQRKQQALLRIHGWLAQTQVVVDELLEQLVQVPTDTLSNTVPGILEAPRWGKSKKTNSDSKTSGSQGRLSRRWRFSTSSIDSGFSGGSDDREGSGNPRRPSLTSVTELPEAINPQVNRDLVYEQVLHQQAEGRWFDLGLVLGLRYRALQSLEKLPPGEALKAMLSLAADEKLLSFTRVINSFRYLKLNTYKLEHAYKIRAESDALYDFEPLRHEPEETMSVRDAAMLLQAAEIDPMLLLLLLDARGWDQAPAKIMLQHYFDLVYRYVEENGAVTYGQMLKWLTPLQRHKQVSLLERHVKSRSRKERAAKGQSVDSDTLRKMQRQINEGVHFLESVQENDRDSLASFEAHERELHTEEETP